MQRVFQLSLLQIIQRINLKPEIMKKLINIAVVVFFLTIGFNARAERGIEVKIQEKEILVVEFGKMENGALLIFQDKKGEILFKDSLINNEPYTTALNLKVLPKGTYYLSVEKEFAILTSVIIKSDAGVEIQGKSSEIVFKPRYKILNDQVSVFLSNPEKTITTLDIFDSKGELVGTCAGGKALFKKTLDFSGMPGGEYTIKIKKGNRTFEKIVSI